MLVKVKEAKGRSLDWMVAQCQGLLAFGYSVDSGRLKITLSTGKLEDFNPSINALQANSIIDQEGISFWTADSWQDERGNFTSIPSAKHPSSTQLYAGETKLTAAMRCYAASKLGEEVDVPNDLMQDANSNTTPLVAAMRDFVAAKLGPKTNESGEALQDSNSNTPRQRG